MRAQNQRLIDNTIPTASIVFQVKICGVRSTNDVEAVASVAGTIKTAVGLNFYPPSLRYVDPRGDEALLLARTAAENSLFSVGVFVNEETGSVCETSNRLGLDAVQFHGDETLTEVGRAKAQLESSSIIRAIKLPTQELTSDTISRRCDPWLEIGCHLLLDADAGAAHGGSGKSLDWPVISTWAAGLSPEVTWTLAGGLKPENVGVAIKESEARSVDTASGVEQPRGCKSAELIHQFFTATQWA